MPLKRGRIIGYDPNRRAFEFTMIDRARVAIIECEISSAAMDQLADIRGAMPAERGSQFLHLRDTIERIASDLFDEGIATPSGMIRIFQHHLR
jgi:hypothetical protein